MSTGSTGTPRIKIAPSILSADFARLGEQVTDAVQAGADMVHIDVMDGWFVPDITFGHLIVRAVRSVTDVPLDVHMMVQDPERVVPGILDAGADSVTVHVEACRHLHRVVQMLKARGVGSGVALNPATSISTVEEILPDVDLVLAMSVNPGYPAQAFIPGVLSKVARLRGLLDERGLDAELEMDGGIGPATAESAVQAGARILVAGSAIFSGPDSIAASIRAIREHALAGL